MCVPPVRRTYVMVVIPTVFGYQVWLFPIMDSIVKFRDVLGKEAEVHLRERKKS